MAILPASQTAVWSRAGVWHDDVKGIPTYSVDINLAGLTSYGGYTLDNTGTSDSTAAIQAAIDACASEGAVYLGPGTYRINSYLDIDKSDVVLRGAVANSTKLVGYGGSRIVRVGSPSSMGPAVFNQTYYVNVSSGATQGSSTVVVADATSILVNDIIRIDQLNDDPGTGTDPRLVQPNYNVINLRPGGTRNVWMGRYGMAGPRTRCAGEHAIVTAKDGNTLTLHRPLNWTYDMSLVPQVGSVCRNMVINSGIENLTIELPNGTYGNLLSLYCALYCWAKNIEFKNAAYRACYGEFNTFGCEVRKCFFNGAQLYGGSQGYGVSWQMQGSDNLVEDCISDGLHCPFYCDAGGDNFVFGYNYSRRTYQDSTSSTWFINDMGSHGPQEWFHLWEGNVCGKLTTDGYHGSGSHQTFLRNWLLGRNDGNTNVTASYHAAVVEMGNHYHSFIGNVLGESGYAGLKEQTPTFEAANDSYPGTLWKVGYAGYYGAGDLDYSQSTAPDPTCASTIIRHGNYDYVSEAIEWDGDIADHVIPDSYYLDSKPSWFGTLSWPPIGSDVSGYHTDIPAKWRWDRYVATADFGYLFTDDIGETTGYINTFDARLVVSESETARLYVEYPYKRVVAGTSAVYTVHVEPYNSFVADVTLDTTGLPTNATDSYGTNPIAYTASTNVTIATTGVAAGTYSMYITGTAVGGDVGSARIILEVVASDDCAPKLPVRRIRVKQGESAVYTVASDPTAGYTGNMDLSSSGVPTGATGTFADTEIAYNESTTFTVDSGTASVGEHEITITGEGPA